MKMLLFSLMIIGLAGLSQAQYTIRPGDTCYELSRSQGITLQQFTANNPQLNCANLQVGANVNGGNGGNNGGVGAFQTNFNTNGRGGIVQPGETCFTIASRNGQTLQQFINCNNGINCNNLRIGENYNLCGGNGGTGFNNNLGGTGFNNNLGGTGFNNNLGGFNGGTGFNNNGGTGLNTNGGNNGGTGFNNNNGGWTGQRVNIPTRGGDTCQSLANRNGFTVAQFQNANPGLNCNTWRSGNNIGGTNGGTNGGTGFNNNLGGTNGGTNGGTGFNNNGGTGFNNNLGGTGFNTNGGNNGGTGFNNNLGGTGFNNNLGGTNGGTNGGTGFNNNLGGTGFNNNLGGTGFNNNLGGTGFNNNQIRSGDTCYTLATRNGQTLSQFQANNRNLNCNNLTVGQTYNIGGGTGGNTGGFNNNGGYNGNMVVRGETCYSIADRNGMSVSQFQGFNPQINCNNLQVGQYYNIRSGFNAANEEETTEETPTLAPGETEAPLVLTKCAEYIVRAGDSCGELAAVGGNSLRQFKFNNPDIDCEEELEVGTAACV